MIMREWLAAVLWDRRVLLERQTYIDTTLSVVRTRSGKKDLLIDDVLQSGPYYENYWKDVIRTIRLRARTRPVKNILILGVGGGTLFHLLRKIHNHPRIVGIDIDAAVLDVAKSEFGLGRMNDVDLVHADAQVYVRETDEVFGFVVVDVFNGADTPEFVTDDGFLADVLRVTTYNGWLMINFSRDKDTQRVRYWKRLKNSIEKSGWTTIATPRFDDNHIMFAQNRQPAAT